MTYRFSLQIQPPGPAGPVAVSVEPLDNGRYRVHLPGDGAECPGQVLVLDARQLARGAGGAVTWSIIPGEDGGGAHHLVDVEGTLPDLRVTARGGEPVAIKVATQEQAARQGAPAAGQEVLGRLALRAPMPGKVVKVLCKAGEAVQAGQGLLVIEAMKMENELRAPAPATIAEVHVSEGQTVEATTALVTLTAP